MSGWQITRFVCLFGGIAIALRVLTPREDTHTLVGIFLAAIFLAIAMFRP